MKRVVIATEVVAELHRRSQEAFPQECCGFLLSAVESRTSDVREIVASTPARNQAFHDSRERFAILPGDLAHAEREADRSGRIVSGFYHSHPDRSAAPSVSDQENAWPWYAYLIVSSSDRATPGEIRAFELETERRDLRPVPCVTNGVSLNGGAAHALRSRGRKVAW